MMITLLILSVLLLALPLLVWRRLTAFALIALLSLPLYAGSVTLQWDASPDASVTGYRVYYGGAAGNYTNSVAVGNVLLVTISLPADQTYYFAAVAFDGAGVESAFSNEAVYTAPASYYALVLDSTIYAWRWPGPVGTLQQSTNLAPALITITNISGAVTNRTMLIPTNWFDVGPIAANGLVYQTNNLLAQYLRVKIP